MLFEQFAVDPVRQKGRMHLKQPYLTEAVAFEDDEIVVSKDQVESAVLDVGHLQKKLAYLLHDLVPAGDKTPGNRLAGIWVMIHMNVGLRAGCGDR
jgi:hypothetical protein